MYIQLIGYDLIIQIPKQRKELFIISLLLYSMVITPYPLLSKGAFRDTILTSALTQDLGFPAGEL